MKKSTVALLIALCALLLIAAWRYTNATGLLRKYPEPQYLTDEESAERPVYEQLGKRDQSIYTALYRGIAQQQEYIPLPYEVDGNDYSRVYCILEKQEGELFFLDSVYYTASKVRDARMVYRDLTGLEIQKEKLHEKVEKAVNGAVNSDDYYLARYINDYIVNNCRYITGEDGGYASTAYGCLVEGEANCEGYAKAFNVLAAELGLKSVLITGETDTGENHAWNQVKVGANWYNIDVTWADTDGYGDMRKMYFLCDDAAFGKTHFADSTLFEPYKCGNSEGNYYARNDLLANSTEKAEEIIRRELDAGNGVIELRFTNEAVYAAFRNEYISQEKIFEVAMETSYSFGDEINLNLKENEQERCMTLDFTAS